MYVHVRGPASDMRLGHTHMHKLKITNCKNHIEELTLTNGTHTIGRSMDSTLRLESDEVSRLHARLFIDQNRCELIDEGSKNGTFVNGNRITSYYLNNGDMVRIGRFNLQFISDIAKPPATEKNGVSFVFFILPILIAFAVLFFYQWRITGKTKLQLAERTAQYLAEKNKEVLYLGEYSSIDLTNLPPGVIQVAVWDRNGKLRAQYPPDAELPDNVRGRSSHIIPIYYESVKVGTLWMKYKL